MDNGWICGDIAPLKVQSPMQNGSDFDYED